MILSKRFDILINREKMIQERRDWYWNEVEKAEGKMVPTKAQ